MDNDSIYPFSQGNRLEDRNTYFYISFQGVDFLSAWKDNRENTLKELGDAKPLQIDKAKNITNTSVPFVTEELLKNIYSNLCSGKVDSDSNEMLKKLLQRFEVTKRMHDNYPENFRPDANVSFNNLSLYVVFAQVLEKAYQISGKLYYLNGLIKIIDTLCSMADSLIVEEMQALAWLINNEYKHIENIAKNQKVTI